MTEEFSKSLVVVLVIVTLIISVSSTLLIFMQTGPTGLDIPSNQNQGNMHGSAGLTIIEPPADEAIESPDTGEQ